jgi:hypothetical protein
MWNSGQQQRLMQERMILAQYFPTLAWYNPVVRGSTYVEGVLTTNGGGRYQVRIMLPAQYLNDCPDMLVMQPALLWDAGGRPMVTASAENHTLEAIGGHTRICHYNPRFWTPQNTIYLVALKGRIWLEAYEAHRRSGRPLDDFLPHMGS